MSKFITHILDVLNVLGRNAQLPLVISGWVEPSTFGLVAGSRWNINGIEYYGPGTYNNINVDTTTFGLNYELRGNITSLSLLSGECYGLELNDTIETLTFDPTFILPMVDFRNANNLHTVVSNPSIYDIHHIYANSGDNADVRDATINLMSVADMPGILYISPDAYYYSELTTQATYYGWTISNI